MLGHEALLSEYPSFPVDPSETAIDNCRKNVELTSDILLLIIGGKRGALDATSGKSITNLEYDTARLNGIPCFVFVNRSVHTLLPVWKRNPNADFTQYVDYPEVFKFIERIQAENKWVFTFEKTAEIKELLNIQLSVMLRELLQRNRAGTLDPIANFASESQKAQRLARDKPPHWEYLLTAELLNTKLSAVRKRYEGLKSGLVHVPMHAVDQREFMAWLPNKIAALLEIPRVLEAQLKVIEASWGPQGHPGDVQGIKTSVDEFVRLGGQLVDWEEDLKATNPPDHFYGLKEAMKGWPEFVFREMEKPPENLILPFKEGKAPSGVHNIMLTLDSPPMDDVNAELAKLRIVMLN
jgi:hypothetical protein